MRLFHVSNNCAFDGKLRERERDRGGDTERTYKDTQFKFMQLFKLRLKETEKKKKKKSIHTSK